MGYSSYQSIPEEAGQPGEIVDAPAAAGRTRTSAIRTGVVALGLCLLAAAVALSTRHAVDSSAFSTGDVVSSFG